LIPVDDVEENENWFILFAVEPGADMFSNGRGEIPGGVGRW
jgi:hypothetical protein